MQSLAKQIVQETKRAQTGSHSGNDQLVSFIQEIPADLKTAMTTFIEEHPNWDQYRLMQAAISGYLLQKGVDSREISRLYFKRIFCKKALGLGESL